MRLPKAEKSKPAAETILKQVQHKVQHDNWVCLSPFVIPNQVLNLALKQVQGLSNSIYDFGISILGFEFGF